MHALPVLLESDGPQVLADTPEAVNVAFADASPIHELDAELESSLRRPYEFIFVELEQLVESPDVRDRRLAHADRADLIRFHQDDAITPLQHFGERSGTHP